LPGSWEPRPREITKTDETVEVALMRLQLQFDED
jgi:hypothetical protein